MAAMMTKTDTRHALAALAFETELGWMAIGSDGRRVHWLRFGYPSQRSLRQACPHDPDFLEEGNPLEAEWVELIRRYASGEQVRLNNIPVQLPESTPFQRRVLNACRAIAWGQTRTYGELAERVGCPGAARAVGTVMSRNVMPLLVPCHRVLGRSGLGGYSAPQGLAMKRRLLALESRSIARPR